MKSLVLSVLLLTSSVGIAGPRLGNTDSCYVGATIEQVDYAKAGLNSAGGELVSVAGDQIKALSAIDRVTNLADLSESRFETAKNFAKYSVVKAYIRIDQAALACDRGETRDLFGAAREILTTAQNGIRK